MRLIELLAASYLVNALWQVPLLTLVAWLAARLARGAVRLQHRVWVLVFLLEVVLPAWSIMPSRPQDALWLMVQWIGHLFHPGIVAAGGVHIQDAVTLQHAPAGLMLNALLLEGLLTGYAIVVSVAGLRLAYGFTRAMLLARSAIAEPGLPTRLCVASSKRVQGPCLVGVLRPRLLVPNGFFDGLTNAERDALLAHEEAHAARHDLLKNLLYSTLSIPICFHPAAWFTCSRIAETREMVCDEMAAQCLASGGTDAAAYARSLIRLACLLANVRPALPLHAIGFADANTLERRVQMLITKQTRWTGWRRAGAVSLCGFLLGAASLSALELRVHVGTQQEGGAAPTAVSAGVIAGSIVSKVMPVYPPEAKADRITGPVILDAVIGKDGSVIQLRVKQSLREDCDQSAIEAVRQWKYKPYLLNGEPTEVQTTITITYSLGQ